MTLVRFHLAPHDGENELPKTGIVDSMMVGGVPFGGTVKGVPDDFYKSVLTDRLAKGPARWDLLITLGQPGDVEDDPTAMWPPNRRQIKAGTLALSAVSAGSENICFDPMVMSDGIAPTADPIIRLRSSAMALSYTRRLQGR